MQTYVHEHGEEMSTKAVMALMLPTLYGRRFFPFYVRPIVAGLDREGKTTFHGFLIDSCCVLGWLSHRLMDWLIQYLSKYFYSLFVFDWLIDLIVLVMVFGRIH